MSSVTQAMIFLVQNLFQLYIFIVLLRFLLQLAKADFYNPISQFTVKATKPLINPLRRIIPGFAGLDIASLVLALVLQLLMIVCLSFIIYGKLIAPLTIVIGSVIGIIDAIIGIYFIGIIASAIVSWIPAAHQHPITKLVLQLVEPILAPFRKILPAMGGLDLSPLFALLLLQVIRILLTPLSIF